MNNFWKGFDKVAAKKWVPSAKLNKILLGLPVKIKNHSIKGIHNLKAGKKL